MSGQDRSHLSSLSEGDRGAHRTYLLAQRQRFGHRSWEVLVLYRKHSGATALRNVGMSVAGVFLIQRLEGSRLGLSTLCVLNSRAGGEGWRKRERIARQASQLLLVTGFLRRYIHAAGDAGRRVAMVFGHALESR